MPIHGYDDDYYPGKIESTVSGSVDQSYDPPTQAIKLGGEGLGHLVPEFVARYTKRQITMNIEQMLKRQITMNIEQMLQLRTDLLYELTRILSELPNDLPESVLSKVNAIVSAQIDNAIIRYSIPSKAESEKANAD